ncbi:MAG: glycerol-3-phosphate dehydrogenase [Hyphomicrobiaceae bacterium]
MLREAGPSREPFDLAIIGGGVNGCGIARDAVGRGLRVALFEKNDLASGTSSASTKLIHGGLRYLEYYEFRLVREALIEREVLWALAPHIIKPMRFILPHHPAMRPAWILRLGLFLYDHLGGRKALPPTRSLALADDPAGAPLKPELRGRAFEYSDCWVDDARLVVLNARDAADRGAVIRTRHKVERTERRADLWVLHVTDLRDGTSETIEARALVNASGPWVDFVDKTLRPEKSRPRTRLVRGAHIVVPRLFEHDRAYILQNADKRIVFAIPYEGRFTLIGTTDFDHRESLDEVKASPEEISYLCEAISGYFSKAIWPSDVVWSFAGVRSLLDDGVDAAQATTRDYKLEIDADGGAPLLSVLGGKITTYRRLAEEALNLLAPHFPGVNKQGWTHTAPLPGGDFPMQGFSQLVEKLVAQYPGFEKLYLERIARAYGTRASRILGSARTPDDLGEQFGGGLSEAEVRYLMQEEWAETAADVVWRRSKLGLAMTPEQIMRLDEWMAQQKSEAASAGTGAA